MATDDLKEMEKAYKEVTMGRDEPDFMYMPVGVARERFGVDIPEEVPNDKIIVISSEGWQLV